MHGVWWWRIHLSYLCDINLQLGVKLQIKKIKKVIGIYANLLCLMLRGGGVSRKFWKCNFYSYHWYCFEINEKSDKIFSPLYLTMAIMSTIRLFTWHKSRYLCIPFIKPEIIMRRYYIIVAIVRRLFTLWRELLLV